MDRRDIKDLFNLNGRTAIITGGAGLLGRKHAEALMECGANCVLVDISQDKVKKVAEELSAMYDGHAIGIINDITVAEEVKAILEKTLHAFSSADILINNAAHNPKFEELNNKQGFSRRFETFSIEEWDNDLNVGLKGAFLCSQIIGGYLATQKRGVILNISSDLGIIAPDQRIYCQEGLEDAQQPTKPVTYSVIKTGLIGLTRYIATYWAKQNVRCNALVPGGVYTGQDEVFVKKLTDLIPMGRMASQDEYKGAVAFLCSDASAYMTGASLVMEGGRTCW